MSTTTASAATLDTAQPSRPVAARVAVLLVFAVCGVGVSNWVPRIPEVRRALDLSEGMLGFALLFPAPGALVAMPFAGWLVSRWGSRPATRLLSVCFCLVVPLPVLAWNLPSLAFALLLFGAGIGSLDVAMNSQGVAVEAQYGRPILSAFHAAFSFGALGGAAMGGLAAQLGIALAPHMLAVGVVLLVVSTVGSHWLLPAHADAGDQGPRFAVPSRPLLVLGFIAFCALVAEGAAADWSAIYLQDYLNTSKGLAAAGFAAFSLTMAMMRLGGDRLAAHWGPVRMVRLGGLIAAAGLGLGLLAAHPVAAMLGFGALGIGIANIFPIVLSAAGRVPGLSTAPAIAAMTTMGYTGFLVGPPLIGFLA
ncbi:MAG: MFS transporter, partial [Chloroflexota bacterium]|nr:MFS transporter [Chloroflexota bacterium]